MSQLMKKFLREENGAVTVDWVVLAAGVVALAVAVFGAMEDGTLSLADGVSSFMTSFTF